MIREWLSSFLSNVRQKTTNPYLGTLLIVWCYRNWDLLFTLFYHQEGLLLSEKKEMLRQFMQPGHFGLNLLISMGLALLLVILTFTLLNISRLITNFFEKRVTPYVYKIFKDSSVVLKIDFDNMMKQRDYYENKFEDEKRKRLEISSKYDELEQNLNSLKNEYNISMTKKADSNEQIDEPIDDNQEANLIFKYTNYFKYHFDYSDIEKAVTNIKLDKPILNSSEMIRAMIKFDLILFKNKHRNSEEYSCFTLTNRGKLVFENILNIDEEPILTG